MNRRSRIKKVIVLAICYLLFINYHTFAEKIGFVDLSKLFDSYAKTVLYEKELEEKVERSGIFEKEKEIEELRDQLSLLSEKEKSKKEAELKRKFEDLQKLNLELTRERDEKMKEILRDIEEAISEYATKSGFSLVLNDRVLVYQDKSLDLTDKVLEILKKKYEK